MLRISDVPNKSLSLRHSTKCDPLNHSQDRNHSAKIAVMSANMGWELTISASIVDLASLSLTWAGSSLE